MDLIKARKSSEQMEEFYQQSTKVKLDTLS